MVGLFALLLFVSSCTSNNTSSETGTVGMSDETNVGMEDFGLRVGESETLFVDLTIRLNQVRDSRCPKGVQCIWAGKVDVDVTLSANGNEETATLGLGEPHAFKGYTITVTGVQPENQQEGVAQSAYVILFTVDNAN